MITRTRISATASVYIHKHNAIINIPRSMVLAIEGAWVRDTEAP